MCRIFPSIDPRKDITMEKSNVKLFAPMEGSSVEASMKREIIRTSADIENAEIAPERITEARENFLVKNPQIREVSISAEIPMGRATCDGYFELSAIADEISINKKAVKRESARDFSEPLIKRDVGL